MFNGEVIGKLDVFAELECNGARLENVVIGFCNQVSIKVKVGDDSSWAILYEREKCSPQRLHV